MFRANPAIQFSVSRPCAKGLWAMSWKFGRTWPTIMAMRSMWDISPISRATFSNLGCHLIDFLVKMLGRPEKVTPFLKSAVGAPKGAKNSCLTVLEYPHTLVTVSAVDQEVKANNPRGFVIGGSKGTLVLAPLEKIGNGQSMRVWLELKKAFGPYKAGSPEIKFPSVPDRYEGQLRELAGIIRGELLLPDNVAHDALSLEVTLTASGVLRI